MVIAKDGRDEPERFGWDW